MSERSLKGIGLFQLNVLHLISIGKKENIETIEKQMDEGNLIEYIFYKYREDFCVSFDNLVYNNKALNKYFQDSCGCIAGNESRQYGIMNETDGLLIILALISDKIEYASSEWKIA